MTDQIDLLDFQWRLAEAKLWWALKFRRDDCEHSLRTPELRPVNYRLDKEYLRYEWGDPEHRVAVVDRVVQARREALAQFSISQVQVKPGRLLFMRPDESLWEGATEHESDGFFDMDDTPPWDTWLAFEGFQSDRRARSASYLINWVQADLVELVTAGIEVSSTDCVGWLDEMDTPLARRLAGAC